MAESFGDSLLSARTGPHPGIEFRIRRAPKEATMPWIRSTLWLIALLLAVICAPARAQTASTGPEQAYPAKPVRLLVGFTPGGGVDINARLLASKLSELLGQQVVVENRPGAGTNIANEHVARSAPDGYTLLFNSPAVAINMSLYSKPPYDALRDFAGVSVFSESTNLLVVPASLAAKSVQELVALARERPGALNYSSAGAGSTQHLAAELHQSGRGRPAREVGALARARSGRRQAHGADARGADDEGGGRRRRRGAVVVRHARPGRHAARDRPRARLRGGEGGQLARHPQAAPRAG